MFKNSRIRSTVAVNIIIILLAAIGVLNCIWTTFPSPPIDHVDQTHRFLLNEPTVYPWARNHIRPLDAIPDPSKETSIFWHIPKVSTYLNIHLRNQRSRYFDPIMTKNHLAPPLPSTFFFSCRAAARQ